MPSQDRYHLIGLWKIWFAEPGLPVPQRRAPGNLVERRAAGFDHVPDEREIRAAFRLDQDRFAERFEDEERIGAKVVPDDRWKAIVRTPGWGGNGERWWERDSRSTHGLSGYDLERGYALTDVDGFWTAAKDFGPSITCVRDSLRDLAVEADIDLNRTMDAKAGRPHPRRRRIYRSTDRSL